VLFNASDVPSDDRINYVVDIVVQHLLGAYRRAA
jgi:hypothetical protein